MLIKYWKVGPFPSVGEFYVLIFDDEHCSRLFELWHVVVQSRLRADVHATLGQAATSELVVRGDRHARVVKLYSSEPRETVFDPPSAFQLVPGAHNKIAVRHRPRAPGVRKMHVHLVDVDTHELVSAWLLTTAASPPMVTRTYDVEVPLGRISHKKIRYHNPWDRPRSFKLLSSDESIMTPKSEILQIPARGYEYIRMVFKQPMRHGQHEAFLFLNDDQDQTEECFLVKILTTTA